MSRAKDDLMDTLHLITAEKLTDIIRNGVAVVDKDGEVVNIPAPAAYISAAIKFLKDNGITADASSERFKDLNNGFGDVPAFDEDEDFDRTHAH